MSSIWDNIIFESIEPSKGIYGKEYTIAIKGNNLNGISFISFCDSNTYEEKLTLKILTYSSKMITTVVPSTLDIGDYVIMAIHGSGQRKIYLDIHYKCYVNINIEVGEPIHINDMNYEDLIHYNIFNKLLSEGKYEEGYQYLVDNKVNFFNANFFNTFQDRLKKTQEYIDANKERITAYEDKPTEKTKNMIWINSKEDS